MLGVQSAADDFGGESESEFTEVDDNGNYISSCDSTSEEGETKCTTNSWTKLDLQHGKAMVEDCAKDRTVHLTRMFSNEREMHYAICPVQEGYSVAFGKGPLVQQGPNKRVYYPTVSIDTSKGMIVIKPNEELTHYEITGGAISNSVGFPCTLMLIVMPRWNASLNVSIRQANLQRHMLNGSDVCCTNREY